MKINIKKRYAYAVALFFGLFALALLIYRPCLNGPFVWDDIPLVVNNTGFHKPVMLFTRALYSASDAVSSSFYYRPLQAFSYFLDYKVWGFNAFGYHFTNILIHSFNAFLLYCLIFRCMNRLGKTNRLFFRRRDFVVSGLVAFLFLVHPIALTCVAYIAGRADLLVCVFILSALLLLDLFTASGKKVFFVACLFAFLAAFLSKESAVLAPFLLISYLALVLQKEKFSNKKTLFALTIGCSVLILFYFALRSGISGVSHGMNVSFAFIQIWLPTLLEMVSGYIVLFFLPLEPHLGRVVPVATSFLNPLALTSFFLLSVFVFLFFRYLKKSLLRASFGLLWFFVWIFPLSFFCILFGRLANFVIMPENHLYVGGIGLLFFLGFFLRKKKIFSVVAGLYLIVFGFLTYQAALVWRDDIVLFEYLIDVNKDAPSSGLVYKNLGLVYKRRGDYEKAVKNYQLALKIDQDASVYHNLGNIFLEQNDLDKAHFYYLRAVSLDPRLGCSYIGMGIVSARQGDFNKAKEMFTAGLKISPNDERLKELVISILSEMKN